MTNTAHSVGTLNIADIRGLSGTVSPVINSPPIEVPRCLAVNCVIRAQRTLTTAGNPHRGFEFMKIAQTMAPSPVRIGSCAAMARVNRDGAAFRTKNGALKMHNSCG
jgi:hypothetical protein